ncbi:pickpocket protein 28-like isoform X2 [Photinus pyralis]|nr:pickpocket protein 28-like isoform X2 [Photinus pyralis]
MSKTKQTSLVTSEMIDRKLLNEKINNYLQQCTLHGLKYVGNQQLCWIERLFWLAAFIAASFLSGYFIITIVNNYNDRIIISINPRPINADRLPFPTITVCDMNRANKNRALKADDPFHKRCLGVLCDAKDPHGDDLLNARPAPIEQVHFINFTKRVSPKCRETVRLCFWLEKEVDCKSIFSSVITNEGACCSFNHFPMKSVFNHMPYEDLLKDRRPYNAEKWAVETGFSPNATNETIPWRLIGSGLTIMLKTDVDNYFCSSTNSAGFKISIADPLELPLGEGLITILPGFKIEIAISPLIKDARTSLTHDTTAASRWCHFSNERKLKLYKSYSLLKCLMECQINYTTEMCNCVPYYALSNRTSPICEQRHKACQNQVSELVTFQEGPFLQTSTCKCLPNCNEYDFRASKSYKRITHRWLLSNFPNLQKLLANESIDNFLKGVAIVKLFPTTYFVGRSTKNEIYDNLELLSNMGGILCIFLGFSFLSAAEIIYHFACEILPILLQPVRERWDGRAKKVQPFAK